MPTLRMRRAVYPALLLTLALLLCVLTACNDTVDSGQRQDGVPASSDNAATAPATGIDSTGSQVKLGAQPCPAAVNDVRHWETIIKIQPAFEHVESVTCGNLKSDHTLQALVVTRADSSGGFLNLYVYDNITVTQPVQLFKREGLAEGSAAISHYNTLLTGEVDTGSSINKGQSDAGLQTDLFHEYQWFANAQSFLPVAFPGIYPHLTRYQAEVAQQQEQQGQQPWLLDAREVANSFNGKFLKWNSPDIQFVSGGGPHDVNATVNIKNVEALGESLVTLKMSRLEGNAKDGIWEIIGVSTGNLDINTPQQRSQLHSPFAIVGKGPAFEGVIGNVAVMDHLYDTIGQTQATGTPGNAQAAAFNTNVTYTSTARESEEGLVALITTSQANGSINGIVMQKVLLLN